MRVRVCSLSCLCKGNSTNSVFVVFGGHTSVDVLSLLVPLHLGIIPGRVWGTWYARDRTWVSHMQGSHFIACGPMMLNF